MIPDKTRRTAIIIGTPVLAALGFRYLFDIHDWSALWGVMTLTFFLSLPYLVGVITIYLSKEEKISSLSYRLFFPWIAIFAFFAVTMALSIEGWACWVMILPIFMIFSSLGGLTAGYFRLRKLKQASNLQLSLAILLPFVLGPVEKLIETIPGFYRADTYIDIEAPKEKIWSNVTRVTEIKEGEDRGRLTNFLQIPRPIKAELDFEGVGARREAIFDRGLIFHERVMRYEHQKLMKFSIRANTYQIPSTTFDEHILIGGDFFDVLEGTYELQPIGASKYRLHLSSKFKLTTTFNFYASIWGRWIMKDIQENILDVIKQRSEHHL